MALFSQGQVIELHGDNVPYDEYFIMGHVDNEAAAAAIRSWNASLGPWEISHQYARWAQTGATRSGEYDREFMRYFQP